MSSAKNPGKKQATKTTSKKTVSPTKKKASIKGGTNEIVQCHPCNDTVTGNRCDSGVTCRRDLSGNCLLPPPQTGSGKRSNRR